MERGTMPTALITGGHTGLGLEAAKQIAAQSKLNLVLALLDQVVKALLLSVLSGMPLVCATTLLTSISKIEARFSRQ